MLAPSASAQALLAGVDREDDFPPALRGDQQLGASMAWVVLVGGQPVRDQQVGHALHALAREAEIGD